MWLTFIICLDWLISYLPYNYKYVHVFPVAMDLHLGLPIKPLYKVSI